MPLQVVSSLCAASGGIDIAHAKSTFRRERLMDQLGKGYRTRYVASIPVVIANDRDDMAAPGHLHADAIVSESGVTSMVKAIFIAPCNCTVARVFMNALLYPTGGTLAIDVVKSVIGASDESLLSAAMDAEGVTSEVLVEGVLSTTAGRLDLIEGQTVMLDVDCGAGAITRSEGLVVSLEWYPREA